MTENKLMLDDAPHNIVGIRINNIMRSGNSFVMPSPSPHKSSVDLRVLSEPTFVYNKVNNYFVAYDKATGFAHSYEHQPGTTDGFAGATITLPVRGHGVVFSFRHNRADIQRMSMGHSKSEASFR